MSLLGSNRIPGPIDNIYCKIGIHIIPKLLDGSLKEELLGENAQPINIFEKDETSPTDETILDFEFPIIKRFTFLSLNYYRYSQSIQSVSSPILYIPVC